MIIRHLCNIILFVCYRYYKWSLHACAILKWYVYYFVSLFFFFFLHLRSHLFHFLHAWNHFVQRKWIYHIFFSSFIILLWMKYAMKIRKIHSFVSDHNLSVVSFVSFFVFFFASFRFSLLSSRPKNNKKKIANYKQCYFWIVGFTIRKCKRTLFCKMNTLHWFNSTKTRRK